MKHLTTDLKYLESFPELQSWTAIMQDQIEKKLSSDKNGHVHEWQKIIQNLPQLYTNSNDFNRAHVQIGIHQDCDDTTRRTIRTQLMHLHPWRKGPFNLFGIELDCEWRSDLKWQRFVSAIEPLDNKLVLDVGCGNGYHSWRAVGENAKLVIGVDPTILYHYQFCAINHFARQRNIVHLPLSLEDIPQHLAAFDSVFSMGILYHQRSPFDHLQKLRDCMKPGGELVMESLVVEGGQDTVFVPPSRYAKMRNVWFIPSATALCSWLARAGFKSIRLLNQNQTTREEQRSTAWMKFESLSDFLDAQNPNQTIEGHPAPTRAIILAKKP